MHPASQHSRNRANADTFLERRNGDRQNSYAHPAQSQCTRRDSSSSCCASFRRQALRNSRPHNARSPFSQESRRHQDTSARTNSRQFFLRHETRDRPKASSRPHSIHKSSNAQAENPTSSPHRLRKNLPIAQANQTSDLPRLSPAEAKLTNAKLQSRVPPCACGQCGPRAFAKTSGVQD